MLFDSVLFVHSFRIPMTPSTINIDLVITEDIKQEMKQKTKIVRVDEIVTQVARQGA